jgi:hypothetical protein
VSIEPTNKIPVLPPALVARNANNEKAQRLMAYELDA